MRKKKIFLILVSLLAFSFHSFQQTNEKNNSEKTTIILVHPYFDDVNSIIYFIENNIIEIPNINLLCIFYKKAQHDYDKILDLIKNNNYPFINLKLIEGNINPKDLFSNNSMSKIYYALFKDSKGIMFFGGYDIPPSIYSQKTRFSTEILNPQRYYFELSFLFHLLGGYQNESYQPFLNENLNYVIHGYCLGMQTMNVATGGSLIQNIPIEIYNLKYVEDVLELEQDKQHFDYKYSLTKDEELCFNFHKISFEKTGFFVNELEYDTTQHPYVFSSHQQSIKDLGYGFKIAATSLDKKVIEAIYHENYINVVGLQFHPEYDTLYKASNELCKFNIDDTNLISHFDFFKKSNSYQFHTKYWKYFSESILKD